MSDSRRLDIQLLRKDPTGTTAGLNALLLDYRREVLLIKLRIFSSYESSEDQLGSDRFTKVGHATFVRSSRRSIYDGNRRQNVQPFQLFPFDYRWAFLERELLQGHRFDVIENPAPGKLVLVALRQTKEEFGVLVVAGFCGHKILASYDRSSVFPLYDLNWGGASFLDLRLLRGSPPDLSGPVEVAEHGVFDYANAIFYSPSYRTRFAEFLKIDFRRIPLPGSLDRFRDLARLGGELVALAESISVMKDIDEVLDQHRGWPGAFQTASSNGRGNEPCAGEQSPSS